MNPHGYTIGDPVEFIPEVVRTNTPREDWSHAYRAAKDANGFWVPITLADAVMARRLVSVAKTRRGMEAESRGRVAFLRVTR